MTIKIAMVAGEASGDLLASHLIQALKEQMGELSVFGIGGPKMQAQGMEIRYDYGLLAVHGYVDAIKRYRQLSSIRKNLLKQIEQERPDIFIAVDAPDFNLYIEKCCKKLGILAIHFISPSIWAWRGGRIKKIKRSVDYMLCLFPFEPEIYQKANVPATYVGHPLADAYPLEVDTSAVRKYLVVEGHPVIALLPGSRYSEVKNLSPDFIQAARLLSETYPNIQFVVPFANRQSKEIFEQFLYELQAGDLPIRLIFGHAAECIAASDVVVVASGTASLEAALLKKPMVICYRIGKWQAKLLKRMAYLPWIGLPNILCKEMLVPELVQDALKPESIYQEVTAWLSDTPRCIQLRERFMNLHQQLRCETVLTSAKLIQQKLVEHQANEQR